MVGFVDDVIRGQIEVRLTDDLYTAELTMAIAVRETLYSGLQVACHYKFSQQDHMDQSDSQ